MKGEGSTCIADYEWHDAHSDLGLEGVARFTTDGSNM